MKKKNKKFRISFLLTPEDVSIAVAKSIGQLPYNSYFLFVNDWDVVSANLLNRIRNQHEDSSQSELNVINIFDIPNGLNILKTEAKRLNESFPINFYGNLTSIPYLVIFGKNGLRYMDYNGSIFSELSD